MVVTELFVHPVQLNLSRSLLNTYGVISHTTPSWHKPRLGRNRNRRQRRRILQPADGIDRAAVWIRLAIAVAGRRPDLEFGQQVQQHRVHEPAGQVRGDAHARAVPEGELVAVSVGVAEPALGLEGPWLRECFWVWDMTELIIALTEG